MASFSFAACGGKVVGEGGDDSSVNHGGDGGVGGDGGACSTFGISCPVCEGDPNSGQASCVDGQWQCAATKCKPPHDNCEDTSADCKCGTPSCIDDQWVCPTDCSGNCPASVDNLDGTPCVTDGLICGDECGDPCSFCNYVACNGGTWNEVESFPQVCDGGAPNVDGG
ncbi:MAG: hypothetical protein ABI183_03390 [Polyangiaceae bacterium]